MYTSGLAKTFFGKYTLYALSRSPLPREGMERKPQAASSDVQAFSSHKTARTRSPLELSSFYR